MDSEGGIHAVPIPSCDQLHAGQIHVIDQPEPYSKATAQAMVYQAMFGGYTGQHGRGYSRKQFRARVLIDSGATRNFVSERYVERNNLRSFQADEPMNVALADGTRMVANRMVAMTLDFGGYKYVQHVYVLPLGVSADVILGMPCLFSLGRFECDMRSNELSFIHKTGHGHQRIVLGGQPDAPNLEKSKILPFGKAITEIRAALRLLRCDEGPTVEQIKAVTKAVRQGRDDLYGYDHEEDPRELMSPDTPLCYLFYLLPSRDAEDEKGGADQRQKDQRQKPRPTQEPPTNSREPRPGTRDPSPRASASPPASSPSATPETKQPKWNLPIPGIRPLWDTISPMDNAEKARIGLIAAALDNPDSTPEQLREATAALEDLAHSHKTLGDTFWDQNRRTAAAAIVREEFEDIFKEELPIREGPEVDTTKTPATIRFKDLYDGETPFRKGIKMAPRELQQCREQLLELLHKGYIGPSASPFGAPILMVPKPNDPTKLRMVVDYRAINALTQSDRYPLPDITTMMQEMQGKKVFSTIDLLWGFWQIPMLEEHKERTAMTTQQFGAFEWHCLPMGLKNSPSIFQRAMQEMLRDLDFVQVYIDDIIIFSDTPEDHVRHLRILLERLRGSKVLAKGTKAKLFRTSCDFLGHVIGADGVSPQQKKVEAVASWPTPASVSDIRAFLGLAGYYRKFIYRFSALATPLNALLKDNAEWTWEPDAEEAAFQQLKTALTTAPLLILPDMGAAMDGSSPFRIQTDASLAAMGGVLMQDQGKGFQPIAFASKSFLPAEMNYSATERELRALIYCTCEEWRHLLWGCDYELQGDHRPLAWLLDPQREISRRQARWLDLLGENDVPQMTWVAGKSIPVPDALSRPPDLMKETAHPRAGLATPQSPHPAQVGPVPDPAEDITPSQPLKEGLLLPELRNAPKAAGMTPEAPSKSPREELKDTRRQIDHRLRTEAPIDDGNSWTIEDLSSRHHNRYTLLREAQRIADQGAGYEDALGAVLSFLGTEEDPPDKPPDPSHLQDDIIRDENGLRWLMPTQGLGSPEHAFETLLALTGPAGGILAHDETACPHDRPDTSAELIYFLPAHVPSNDGPRRRSRERPVSPNPCLWDLLAHIEDTITAKAGRVHRLATVKDWADYNMIAPEFHRWQKTQGPYDVDGCCDPEGRNRQPVKGKSHWWDCTANDFTNKNIWLNPPFEAALVRAILRRLHQGRQNSASTNATLILPAYVIALVRDQLDLMPHLKETHRYPIGTKLFKDPAGTILPTKWEVVVLCTDQANSLGATPSPVCQTCDQGTGTRKNKLLPCSHCGAQSHAGCMKVLGKAPICGACTRPGTKRAAAKPEKDQSLLKQLETSVLQDAQYQSWLNLTNQPRLETGRQSQPGERPFRCIGKWLWRVEEGGLQFVVPDNIDVKDQLLQDLHSSAAAGHLGSAKTYERLARRFWWPGMRADVLEYCSKCVSCQQNKTSRNAKQGVMHPVPIPSRRFGTISVDFVTGLPTSYSGHDAVMTITDKYSKVVRLVPMKFGDSASASKRIARLFVDNWWRDRGIPTRIISDRDVRFTSSWWEEFVKLIGSKAAMTTSYHPQANGQAENTNRTMETILRAYIEPRQKDWDEHLAAAEFAINDSVHASTGYTPFQLICGESPMSHLDLFLEEITKVNPPTRDKNRLDARNFMQQWRNNLGDARKALEVAQAVQSQLYDRSRKDVQFALGDRLLISRKHLSIPADRDVPWKLKALYDGDYPVTKVHSRPDGSAFAYQLKLPPKMIKNGLHDVFAPDKLVKFRGESKFPSQQQEEEETAIVDGRTEYVVRRIWAHRVVFPPGRAPKQGKRLNREYLVEWKGDSSHGSWTWKKVADLNEGGVLGPWLDYEAAILRWDPAKASQLAKDTIPQHTGGADRGQNIRPDDRTRNAEARFAANSRADQTGAGPPDVNTTSAPPQTTESLAHPVPAETPDEHTAVPAPATGTRRSARLLEQELRAVHTAEQVRLYELEHAVDVGNRPLRVLVLFSGGGSVKKAIHALYPNNRLDIVAVDSCPKSSATLVTDINEFAHTQLFNWRPGYFDILWASPPCTEYSHAKSIGDRDLEKADKMVASALACLIWLKPRYWFIENPVGMLADRPLMIPFQPYLQKVSYCHYGEPVRKDTCIWTNAPVKNLLICRKGSMCPTKESYGRHLLTAQAGPSNQVPGSGAGKNVYHIPQPLLKNLLGPSILAWTLIAQLSELL